MPVDLAILRNDPTQVVLRQASLPDFGLGMMLVVSVFALTFVLFPGDAAASAAAPAARLIALCVGLGLAGLILYRALFRLAVTTTFRPGSDEVERRVSGVCAGRTWRLDGRQARVRIAGRDDTTIYINDIPVRTPPVARLELVLKDGTCLPIGSIEEGSAMLLAGRLNAMLPPSQAVSVPPAP
jgi:hypothetical protein